MTEPRTLADRLNDWRRLFCSCCQYPELQDDLDKAIAALRAQDQADNRAFKLGQRVTKKKGSNWTGCVVGFYSTSLTPIGYAVESENEKGSVQIYPETALASMEKDDG